MSQHHCKTTLDGCPVRLVAGYDRPLGELFLHVFDARSDANERLIFASMYEPFAEWRDPRTLRAKLLELRLDVPETFVAAIIDDQRCRAGNKIVVHHFGRVPEITYV